MSLSEPRIHEKPEVEYIYIYICAWILHSNNSMRMVRHHVLDCLLWLVKVVIDTVNGQITESWQCTVCLSMKDGKNWRCGVRYLVIFDQNYLFISSWSHGSDNHSRLAWYSEIWKLYCIVKFISVIEASRFVTFEVESRSQTPSLWLGHLMCALYWWFLPHAIVFTMQLLGQGIWYSVSYIIIAYVFEKLVLHLR